MTAQLAVSATALVLSLLKKKGMTVMTQNEIIEMAKEAGFWQDLSVYEGLGEHFKAFAKLVAAKEREACAKVCEKEAEDAFDNNDVQYEWCAKLIRARGES